jgi:hypothetical protein
MLLYCFAASALFESCLCLMYSMSSAPCLFSALWSLSLVSALWSLSAPCSLPSALCCSLLLCSLLSPLSALCSLLSTAHNSSVYPYYRLFLVGSRRNFQCRRVPLERRVPLRATLLMLLSDTSRISCLMERSVLCSLFAALYSLLSALCSLLSALCSLLSALCSLLSALCSLLSALSSQLSGLCSLVSANIPTTKNINTANTTTPLPPPPDRTWWLWRGVSCAQYAGPERLRSEGASLFLYRLAMLTIHPLLC